MAKLYFISFFILVSTIVSAESEIEDLIVTGSFIKKNSQGPLPLESINNDEYRKLNISNIAEINIKIGPENKANQATKARGLISLLSGLTTTWPSAHIADPKIVRPIPINFPSKLGDPVKT